MLEGLWREPFIVRGYYGLEQPFSHGQVQDALTNYPLPADQWLPKAADYTPCYYKDYLACPKGALSMSAFKGWKKNPLKGLHPGFLASSKKLRADMEDWSYLFLQLNG